jgi:hypothetical protein
MLPGWVVGASVFASMLSVAFLLLGLVGFF